MRKQMRSTFRTPGTEDGSVSGNAHRSGGAEVCSAAARAYTPRHWPLIEDYVHFSRVAFVLVIFAIHHQHTVWDFTLHRGFLFYLSIYLVLFVLDRFRGVQWARPLQYIFMQLASLFLLGS
jgi:hypothetical protein